MNTLTLFYLMLVSWLFDIPVKPYFGLGIRKIVLIEPKGPPIQVFGPFPLPRLGTLILATILEKQGYEVSVYVESLGPIDWNDIRTADAVCFSNITVTTERYRILAKRVRKISRAIIISGGPQSTFMPEDTLRYCDYVIRGEGQDALPELLAALSSGRKDRFSRILGLSRKDYSGNIIHNPDRPNQKDLGTIPFPDMSLIKIRRSPLLLWFRKRMVITPIITSLGCPYDCDFCSVTAMFGRQFRTWPVEDVLAYIEQTRPKVVFFYDDYFFADPGRAKRLMEGFIRLQEKGIYFSWSAQARIEVATKFKHLHDLLKRSGCKVLYIGIEAVTQETLDAYNKKLKVEDIEEGIRIFEKELDIRVHGMFVNGADTDNRDTAWQIAEFAIRNNISTIQMSISTPLPGSKLTKRLDKEGRIFQPPRFGCYGAHHVVYWPKPPLTPYQLQHSNDSALMKGFYSSGRVWQLYRRKTSDRLLWVYNLYGWYMSRRLFISNIPYRASLLLREMNDPFVPKELELPKAEEQ